MAHSEHSNPRIACLYGAPFEPFVGDIIRDLSAGVFAVGGHMFPVTIENACAHPGGLPEVDALYVLPFDSPGTRAAREDEEALVGRLFPRVPLVTPFAVQNLCWDKVATQERLLKQGVPMPAAIVTDDFAEVKSFVREHRFAILKEPKSCGGAGHLVAWIEDGRVVGDCGSHQYRIEPRRGGRIELDGDRLHYPGPYYLQRLIAHQGRGMPLPGQVLRAYIVDKEVPFWTERYRENYRRPSDLIINAGLGARYRFLHNVSHEAKMLALRAAEALGMTSGVIDLIRTPGAGPYVLEADVDSRHMVVDRSFKRIPEYRDFFDFDDHVARAVMRGLRQPPPEIPRAERTARRHKDRAPRRL